MAGATSFPWREALRNPGNNVIITVVPSLRSTATVIAMTEAYEAKTSTAIQ